MTRVTLSLPIGRRRHPSWRHTAFFFQPQKQKLLPDRPRASGAGNPSVPPLANGSSRWKIHEVCPLRFTSHQGDYIENKDPVAPWGCVFERNTADSEKQIDLQTGKLWSQSRFDLFEREKPAHLTQKLNRLVLLAACGAKGRERRWTICLPRKHVARFYKTAAARAVSSYK